MTGQLLAFSRRQVTQPRPLDLNSVVKDIKVMMSRLIGEDIQVQFRPGTELWTVSADVGQIQQVVLNLAVNARDAMPNGGDLIIETRNVTLDGQYLQHPAQVTLGDYVMISVTDTGVGMDQETLARIFEPFFTTKEVGKGTGLGLATVYGIVKQSSGFVWVYSEVGIGSTFKVYLPRIAPNARSRCRRSSGARRRRGTKRYCSSRTRPICAKSCSTISRARATRCSAPATATPVWRRAASSYPSRGSSLPTW